MQRSYVRDLVQSAVSAALFVICAWITIPGPGVTFTLQSFALYLILFVFGGRRTLLSCIIYLMLGIIGLPVFSGFQGASALVGATGGYLWGFIPLCLIYQGITFFSDSKWAILSAAAAGTLVCYLCGTLWFWLIFTGGSQEEFAAVAINCTVPYIIPDSLKLLLAYRLSCRLQNNPLLVKALKIHVK